VVNFSWSYWRKGEGGLNWLLSSYSVFGITDAESMGCFNIIIVFLGVSEEYLVLK
jgi:hypothetical protein